MAEEADQRFPDGPLFQFLERLSREGFDIGTDRFVRCGVLLERLRADGRMPKEIADLGPWISPVVCSSPGDQAVFRSEFAAWAATTANAQEEERRREEGKHKAKPPKTPAASILMGIVVSVLVAAITAGIYALSRTGGGTASAAAPRPSVPGASPVFWELIALNLDRFGAALLPWLVLGLVFLVRHFSLVILGRTVSPKFPAAGRLRMAALESPVFPLARVRRQVQMLRDHFEQESRTIDIERTLRRHLRMTGMPTVIYKKRQRKPEYLLLVDRVSADDHQAALADLLCAQLRAGQVMFERYDYHRVPQLCLAHGPRYRERAVTLDELATLYPGHRLLILADGQAMRDPLSREPQPWMRELEEWPTRILMTPCPPSRWGGLEEELQEAGYIVVPASSEGLESLAAHLRSGETSPVDARKWAEGPFPSLLALRPWRWIQSLPPESGEAEELLGQLRRYLGSAAFELLCCCAVFPILSAEVTLHLGSRLTSSEGGSLLTEAAFVRLSRLPWFRRGFMPDWLRRELIGQLPPSRDAEVREVLTGMLLRRPQDGEAAANMALAEASPRRLTALLINALERHPHEPASDDRIFLSFMRGWRPSRLQLGVSRRLAERLGAIRAEAWAAVGVALAAGTSAAIYFGAGSFAHWARMLFTQLAGLPPTVWQVSGSLGLGLAVAVLMLWHMRAADGRRSSKVMKPTLLFTNWLNVVIIIMNAASLLVTPVGSPANDISTFAVVLGAIAAVLHTWIAPIPAQAAAYTGPGLLALLDLRGWRQSLPALAIAVFLAQSLYLMYAEWVMYDIFIFPHAPFAAAVLAAPWYAILSAAVLLAFRRRLEISLWTVAEISLFAALGRVLYAPVEHLLKPTVEAWPFAGAGLLFLFVTYAATLAAARHRLLDLRSAARWAAVASLVAAAVTFAGQQLSASLSLRMVGGLLFGLSIMSAFTMWRGARGKR